MLIELFEGPMAATGAGHRLLPFIFSIPPLHNPVPFGITNRVEDK
jgi:hypothetical protein